MENASKALLIAGAILLAILLISLGLLAFRGASDTVTNNNMDAAEIEAFNMKWEKFIGTNVSASNVNALISSAIAHNQSELSNGTNRFVTVRIAPNSHYDATNITSQFIVYGPETDAATTGNTLNMHDTGVVTLPSVTNYSVQVRGTNTNDNGRSASGLIRHIWIEAH